MNMNMTTTTMDMGMGDMMMMMQVGCNIRNHSYNQNLSLKSPHKIILKWLVSSLTTLFTNDPQCPFQPLAPFTAYGSFRNCTRQNHGTAGNHEVGGFVNSAVRVTQEFIYVSKYNFSKACPTFVTIVHNGCSKTIRNSLTSCKV